MNPLVSVIIPIYNVAPYLRECLDSVLSQTYSNLQIILVNDGSSDESESIAKECLRDNRVELVSVLNGGLSYARNIGLDRARGEYIYFIDSDDYIDLGYIEELVSVAREFGVEFVCNDNIAPFGLGEVKERPKSSPQLLIPDSQNIALGGAVWRCLFAKSLLERSGVRFLERKIYEDEGFLYMILPFLSSFARFSGLPYFYRQRENSIMSNHKKFRSYDLLDVFEAIYRFYQERGFIQKFKPPYYFLYSCSIGYENEREYLARAKKLAKSLHIPPPHKGKIIYAFLYLPPREFVVFLKFYNRISSKAIRVRSFLARKIKFWK
ncbi:glycosyltransferase family 2 protein [Helicobacter brantae]|uniref:Glycosyltransferase 2-like domain-containing protein n=1 Tax=Helicobacter brantae TaxID=375927 RepID=A0A3D8J1T4_9HELI|nr:glycosyltransferase family A protein [Helicobacter brantae]RDU71477.1 hypothetical protein CQA58_02730 [Helicobacter brantae]